jgi:pimeloyl-ACP methyl ester carboxylesterase
VILIHGLWLNGVAMALLGRRLRRCGYRPLPFPHAEVSRSPRENAERLQHWLTEVPGPEVHFVAHSLGGILLLHLFDIYPQQRPGRVVLLGSPVQGSAAARRLYGLPLLGRTLGRSVEQGLLGGAPAWAGHGELGIVAGSLELGLGRLLVGDMGPSDGTVALAETRLDGAKERITVRANHYGLLLGQGVARQVCAFLGSGHFDPGA